jgi:Ca2+-binding EF-hand superfamily protein
VDTDNSGLIDLKELARFLRIEADIFLCRCFAIFDEDDSGFIDFGEFVLSLWNYCTHTPDSLMLFAFGLFNVDKSGYMSKEELLSMLRVVYR